MKALWTALVVALAMTANGYAQIPLPEIPESQKQELVGYLTENWMSPEDYVVSKFKDHDIVFVGERHRVKHDPELIQHLIPHLYEAGVYNLGIEFGCTEMQDSTDYLLSAPDYDEALARRIMFKSFSTWGYIEYEDLYRRAWELNQALPADAPKFRIVNLNYRPRWDLAVSAPDGMSYEEWARVWYRGSSDDHMARLILDEFVKQGKKALVYSGNHHAFTRYHQPEWDDRSGTLHGFMRSRMGNIVRDSIPDRVFTIMLHSPWWTKYNMEAGGYPVGGAIDAALTGFADKRVGFDVVGSPFGELPDTLAYYSVGYSPFRLSDYCDGYVYQRPFSEYAGCTVDTLFVTDDNFKEAVAFIADPSARPRFSTPADFVTAMRTDADIPKIFQIGMTQALVSRRSAGGTVQIPEIPEPQRSALVGDLTEHWQSPEDYIVSKFAERDIVFLGGWPTVRQDVELVQRLIPLLYRAGVLELGISYAPHELQDTVDYLINAPTYDEKLARLVMFKMIPYWAYKEYEDIYRAAWDLNRSLPEGAPRFRIVNLSYRPRWDLATTVMNAVDSQRVWDKGTWGQFTARVVLDEFVKQGKKALIYCSFKSGFTRYRWPQTDPKTGEFVGYREREMGNIVSDSIPSRVFSISLHSPWMQRQATDGYMFSYPAGGTIDALMREFESPRVGFDIIGSHFATLSDSTSVFSVGYSPFVLADFCDGYIYQGSISSYEPCTIDTLFVTNANFDEAVRFFPNVRARQELRAPADFMDMARNDGDIRRHWSNLR